MDARDVMTAKPRTLPPRDTIHSPARRRTAEHARAGPMDVRDVMTAHPRTLSPNDTSQSAAGIMKEEDAGAVPIVENGKLVGMVTDRDIVIRAVADGSPGSKSVREIASGNVVCTQPG